MIDSILLYLSALFTIAGAIRRDKRLLAAGLAGTAITALWPARERRATGTTQLDRAMPVWEFDEIHETEVAADPNRIFDAIKSVRAEDIAFFRALTAIRRGGRRGPETILNPARNQPILDVALRSGFFVMADDTPHEIVIGSIIIRPNRAVAAMNFRVIPEGTRCRLITETRVHATDAAARRRFAIYWRIIHPGSDIIRRSWLHAIRLRAESSALGR